jgi:hypothetical protein
MKIDKDDSPGKEFRGGVCESSSRISATMAHRLTNFNSLRSSTTPVIRDVEPTAHAGTMEDEAMECVLCFAVMKTLRKDTQGEAFPGALDQKVTRRVP